MTYHIEDYTQDQLPYDWDSEEAQGTVEELEAEASECLTDAQAIRMLYRSGVSDAFSAGLDNRGYVDVAVLRDRVVGETAIRYGRPGDYAFLEALEAAFDAGARVDEILNA